MGISFLYYIGAKRTETVLQEPYATLTISRLDNFIPTTMAVPFHPVDDIMMSSQVCGGCFILREAITDANYIYNQSESQCNQKGELQNGYCDYIPIYAVYSINLTRDQYSQVTSAESVQFLNSTKSFSSILYYKGPKCFSYAHGLMLDVKKDGFCYYGMTIVKNNFTEG